MKINNTRWLQIRELNVAFKPGRQLAKQEFAARLSRARLVYLRHRDSRWNWIALCLCLGLTSGLFWPAAPVLAQLAPQPDVHSGALLVTDGDTGARVPVPRLATNVEFKVSGLIARVTVEQRFINNRSEWLEGVYMLPLPDDAAVDTLEISIGDRVIVGEIREKAEARKLYQAAKKSGKHTGLIEAKRPNLFSVLVANIAPGEEVLVRIAYLQTLKYDDGSYSMRFPLTLTPRYEPPGSNGLPAEATQYASFRDAKGDDKGSADETVSIRALIDAGVELARIESPFHDIVVNISGVDTTGINTAGLVADAAPGTAYEVTLANGYVRPEHDFQLIWTTTPGAQPGISVFTEQYNGETYALMMFMPPDEQVQFNQPRELVFVIDTSGSMGGASIRQATVALHMALDWLTAVDRFNVIEFNSVTHRLFVHPAEATTANIRKAHRFVGRLRANGGTNMAPALKMALASPPADDFLRQVVFITDGSVGNEVQLFRLVAQNLASSRLFTVGIGSAPNDYFMRKAAQFGRGTYTFIGAQEQVGERMGDLFARLRKPVLTDIDIQWPDATALKTWPARIPDLYAGEPVVVTAKLDKHHTQLMVSGKSGNGYWSRQPGIDLQSNHDGVATLWARRQIETLMDQQFLGADPVMVRKAVLRLALEHRIVSRYTSLVAVEQMPLRPMHLDLRTQRFANLKPAGAVQTIGMPPTATASRLNLWLGVSLLLGALLIELLMRLVSRQKVQA